MSKCGVICQTDCKAYQVECEGCNELSGKVSWAPFYGKELCPIYECVVKSGFESCAPCGKAPCAIWLSTRNPDISDEVFEADLQSRIKNLNRV